ncbi:hypothetical protein SFRURICE_015884 [Spodoptera frugiperda]|nr:hypothetical protein SFRURICE_015884 [Spodoptera frugiperda]
MLLVLLLLFVPEQALSDLRILGGQNVNHTDYRFVARVEAIVASKRKHYNHQVQDVHVCTGVVLSQFWTLTAAHCVKKPCPDREPETTAYDIVEMHKHSGYRDVSVNENINVKNDIALLHTEPIPLQEYGKIGSGDFTSLLKCGHVFHLHCCRKVLANKWIGPRITFSFSQCPICKEDMNHWTLEELLAPIRQLYDEVKRKALMRLEYEGCALPGQAKGKVLPDPATYAMERYAYYVCHKCGKAYFGGLARCEAETSGWWEPNELVCGACSDVAGARTCPKHGADFLEYKCRYCCSVAVFFCFGTSHFCNACHDDFQRVTSIPKHLLPQCPAGPKGEQLPGSSDECPLHVQHPPTGEEFALGCGVCRHAQGF